MAPEQCQTSPITCLESSADTVVVAIDGNNCRPYGNPGNSHSANSSRCRTGCPARYCRRRSFNG
ncbi:hypothetical protein Agau_C100487 [Agrobacterium tumefaciens F2]|nr:hypothetical protein Agau_C100487 [Agrobacterium tumefaciens F2]